MRAAILAATALGTFRRVSHSNHSDSGRFCQVSKLSEVSRPIHKVIIFAGKVWHMPVAVGIKAAQRSECFGEDVGNHGGDCWVLVNNRPGQGKIPPPCDGQTSVPSDRTVFILWVQSGRTR